MLQLVDCGEQSSSLAGVNGRGAVDSRKKSLSDGKVFTPSNHIDHFKSEESGDLIQLPAVSFPSSCLLFPSFVDAIHRISKKKDMMDGILPSFLEQIDMPFHQIRRDITSHAIY